MKMRWIVWLLPLALAFGCLRTGFSAAAALDALGRDGYSLRPAAPLRAGQAEQLQKAAAEQELDLAFWTETDGEAVGALDRTAPATGIACWGEPSLAFGTVCLYGRLPAAAETDACAVTLALARALWGGEDVTGLELRWQDRRYIVCGVVEEERELWLLYPAQTPDLPWTGVELGSVPRGDPRGAARQLAMTAALDDALAVPGGTLAAAARLLVWLPLALAGVALLVGLVRGVLRRLNGPVQKEALLFALALAGALALPLMLETLPGWVIPNRWSDFAFWSALAELPGQTLRTLLALPPSVRDTVLRLELLRAAFSAAGALLALTLAWACVPFAENGWKKPENLVYWNQQKSAKGALYERTETQ